MKQNKPRDFTVTVTPVTAGHKCGYVARWGRYQFWALSRAEVIKDILERISVDLKIK